MAYSPVLAKYFPDGRLTFTPMQPTALPNGIRLTSTSLTASKQYDTPTTYNKSISYSVDTDTISISQEHTPFSEPLSCRLESANASCRMVTTQNNRQYRVETNFVDDNNNPTADSTQFIQYIEGDTYTFIHVKKGAIDRYSDQDWSNVIDGLKPVKLKQIPITVRDASRG